MPVEITETEKHQRQVSYCSFTELTALLGLQAGVKHFLWSALEDVSSVTGEWQSCS